MSKFLKGEDRLLVEMSADACARSGFTVEILTSRLGWEQAILMSPSVAALAPSTGEEIDEVVEVFLGRLKEKEGS